MTGQEPQPIRPEDPFSSSREISRPPFGFREVMVFAAVVTLIAAILVVLLYMSPLAAR
jgi:hypothetical protein